MHHHLGQSIFLYIEELHEPIEIVHYYQTYHNNHYEMIPWPCWWSSGHRAVLLPWFSDHSISNPAEVSSFIQCNCKKGIKERQKMTIAYL